MVHQVKDLVLSLQQLGIAAIVQVQSPAQALPHAMGAAKKKKGRVSVQLMSIQFMLQSGLLNPTYSKIENDTLTSK